MKKRLIYSTFSLILFVGVLSACTDNVPPPSPAATEAAESLPAFMTPLPIATPSPITTPLPITTPSPITVQTWQTAYEELLRASEGEEFFLCDIENDGVAELLVGGTAAGWSKHAYYDCYTYKNGTIKYLGEIVTLSGGEDLWLDGKGGILGYDYGAGSGEAYRYYIKDDVLIRDGDVYGYYYEDKDGPDVDTDDPADNLVEWFRGTDGEEVVVTEETADEYQEILDSEIRLECYRNTKDNITAVIYG